MITPEHILDECKKILKAKGHDYTDGDRHQNFERSESVISWYEHDIDKVYVTLITTKMARLAVLLSGRKPNNESIADSFKDLVNYCTLWGSKRS